MIKKLRKGKKTVYISHWFNTVREADKILVMEKGGIAWIGWRGKHPWPTMPITTSVQHAGASNKNQRTPIDLYGPIAIMGTNYYDYIGMTWIYPLKKKSSGKVQGIKGRNSKSKRENWSDVLGHMEEVNMMKIHLEAHGIIHEPTAPYSPDQSGIAESVN